MILPWWLPAKRASLIFKLSKLTAFPQVES